MQLTIVLEQRFRRTPDGRCWTESTSSRSFWSRYLTVFDGLKIVARVHEVSAVPDTWKRVDGDGVTVAAVPAYVGPREFAVKALRVRSAVARAVADDSALLLRVPGMIATLACTAMEKRRPYGVEVVGDPYGVRSPGMRSSALTAFLRWSFTRILRAQCRKAACNLYVTEQALQRRYPPGTLDRSREDSVVGVSDVELSDAAFASSAPPGVDGGQRRRFRVAFVGALEVGYKGLDVLIEAVATCVRAGVDAELTILGTGRQRSLFETQASRLGLLDRVTFLGSLPAGEPVRRQLDASDLFVLPSRQEGMPRALIEAMARGLPCIATRVGGVPELLPEDVLVAPGDAGELAAKILQLDASPRRRARLGAQNLAKARCYHEDLLQPRRVAFHRYLRDVTEAWRRKKRTPVRVSVRWMGQAFRARTTRST
jgi:glycosyltransferase involved in cell wall biosynthesis